HVLHDHRHTVVLGTGGAEQLFVVQLSDRPLGKLPLQRERFADIGEKLVAPIGHLPPPFGTFPESADAVRACLRRLTAPPSSAFAAASATAARARALRGTAATGIIRR